MTPNIPANTENFEFEMRLNEKCAKTDMKMAKSVQIELSYTKTADAPIDLNMNQIFSQREELDNEWSNLNNKVMRIPLVVEHLTGS